MPSLHHGAIFFGVFLIVTGGSTAFMASSHHRLQAFSLCCVVLGVVMLILGLFWAMNRKNAVNYNQREFDPECPHYPYDYPNFGSHALFTPMGSRFPESQSVFLPRWVKEKWHWHVQVHLTVQSVVVSSQNMISFILEPTNSQLMILY